MISLVLTYCDGDVEQVQFLLIEKIQDMHKQFLEESQLNFSAVRFVKYKIHINLVFRINESYLFIPLRSGDTYMRQWTRSSLV